MTALPKWIDRSYGIDFEKNKLKEALAIAWEALEDYRKMAEQFVRKPEEHMLYTTANIAMRRITELGKE